MPPPPHLTASQLKLAAERRAAKLAKRAQQAVGGEAQNEQARLESERRRFMKRDWTAVADGDALPHGEKRLRLVTWNVNRVLPSPMRDVG